MLIGVAAALLACVCYGAASVLQAYGARRSSSAARGRAATGHVTPAGGPTLRSTVGAALTAAFLVGIVLDLAGFAGSIISARLIPLFLSQNIISANLVVTAILGAMVLGIDLHTRDRVAICTVLVSLLVLGLASGDRGGATSNQIVHWSAFCGAVLILLLGVALGISAR